MRRSAQNLHLTRLRGHAQHLVENLPERPDVGPLVLRVASLNLRRHQKALYQEALLNHPAFLQEVCRVERTDARNFDS